MEPRLKAGIRVKALIRRCDLAVIGVAVLSRGDPDAGAILLKLSPHDGGCTVLAEARRPDGTGVWMRATGRAPIPEADADAYIARQRRRDPDLWVLEIEPEAVAELLDSPILADCAETVCRSSRMTCRRRRRTPISRSSRRRSPLLGICALMWCASGIGCSPAAGAASGCSMWFDAAGRWRLCSMTRIATAS